MMRSIKWILGGLILVLAGFSPRAATTVEKPCPLADADLWVLAGQSNMAGSAQRKAPIPTDPRIMLFNMDDSWIPAQEPLTRIFESNARVHRQLFAKGDHMTEERFLELQAQSKREPQGGVGPGLFFANHLLKSIDRPIGLIASAHGGTTMRQWDPALKDKGDESLYGAMLGRIAMTGGKVKGILWYQGESEAMEPADAEVYETTFLNFIDCLRRDLNALELPFIFVQIGGYTKDGDPRAGYWEQAREIQRRVAQQRPGVWMVSAIDLPTDDEIHVGFDGHQRLGVRLAEVALSEVYKLPQHATPIDLDSIQVTDANTRRPVIRVRFKGVNGPLTAAGRPTGFRVRFPGREGQTPQIYRVDFDPEDSATVLLRLGAELTAPVELIYGAGMYPYVNIVDSKDMAVPAFGPIPLDVAAKP